MGDKKEREKKKGGEKGREERGKEGGREDRGGNRPFVHACVWQQGRFHKHSSRSAGGIPPLFWVDLA